MIAAWLIPLAVGACPELGSAPVVLAVTSADPELTREIPVAQARLRAAGAPRLELLGPEATAAALTSEGGRLAREQVVIAARAQLAHAEARFRELDDEAALAGVTRVTTQLVAVHQTEGAIRLLAEAHLLAAAIYLARGRPEVVQTRLQRALDLAPDVSAPRHRFDPRLAAELAAARDARALRPTGRLEVTVTNVPEATVFLDGQLMGPTPFVLDAIAVGRHLLRVSADRHGSHLVSIRVEERQTSTAVVTLAPDPERQIMDELGTRLRAGDPPEPLLALLARRAGAEYAVVGELVLSARRDATATATVGLRVRRSGGGQGWAEDLSPPQVAQALEAAMRCHEAPWPGLQAPAMLGRTLPAPEPHLIPEAPKWWDEPWVWAAAAGLVLGAASAAVAAQAAAGPPDAVSVTLVPRP